MGTAIGSREYGPSWGDVLDHLELLERSTGRSCSIEIARTVNINKPSRLYFRVVARERLKGNKPPGEMGAGFPWPHSDFRTVPAMLLHLIYVVDRKLEDAAMDAAKQAAF